jgi:hypothetical protein
MNEIIDTAVTDKYNSFPEPIREKMLMLRALIYEVAVENSKVGKLQECLKWGEPAYLAPGGSAIRVNWKAASPNQFFMYFNCKTSLVDTFRELYGDTFSFQGNRAIVFTMQDEIPLIQLKHCIAMSLNYHRIKHSPLLGA